MEKEAAIAKWRELHSEETGRVWHNGTETSWSKVRDDGHPYHFTHGVTIWVSRHDVNPDDQFLSVTEEREPDEAGDEG